MVDLGTRAGVGAGAGVGGRGRLSNWVGTGYEVLRKKLALDILVASSSRDQG